MLTDGRVWYFILLAAAAATLLLCLNLLRARTGRAWRAIRAHETVAEALGIGIAGYKLLAFVISSAITAVAGALFAYYRGFVSVEAFSLFLTIQYLAMVIIGGMGSLLGALLGAAFVTLFPYVIEGGLLALPDAQGYASLLFAVNYAAFGLVMILFLMFEPLGLVGIWRRIQSYFLLWPFKHRSAVGTAPMTSALLAVEKLEVVYHRAITAVQGITLTVGAGQIVALLGTNGAGKTTTLRAISGFLGLDDARVTEGAISFKGERIENRPPHDNTRRGDRAGAGARQGVSQSHRGGKSRRSGPARHHAGRAAQARGAGLPVLSPARRPQAPHRRASFRRRAADAGARERARLPPAIAAGRRALARPRAGRGRGPAAPAHRRSGASSASRILLVEQSATVALEIADYGYVMENGRIVLDGSAERLRSHPDIQEFYLGRRSGERASYRDVKQYRRSRRWYG